MRDAASRDPSGEAQAEEHGSAGERREPQGDSVVPLVGNTFRVVGVFHVVTFGLRSTLQGTSAGDYAGAMAGSLRS